MKRADHCLIHQSLIHSLRGQTHCGSRFRRRQTPSSVPTGFRRTSPKTQTSKCYRSTSGETGEDSVSGTASTYDGSLTEEGAEGFGGFRATYGGPDGDTAGGETPGGIQPFQPEEPGDTPGSIPEEELSFVDESRAEGQAGDWDHVPTTTSRFDGDGSTLGGA